ncbi:aldehyde oxidase GLOX-like [Capsicum galapagoense]
MDKESIIFLFLLVLIFFTLQPPLASQMLVSHSRRRLLGEWRMLQKNIGISAVHMQLLHNNKVVIFDTTDFDRSNLSLPGGRYRYDPNDMVSREDCYSHSVLYDIGSNTFWALMIQTDPYCSSGAVLPDEILVQIGGYNDGDRVIHTLAPCTGENCDWVELTHTLIQRRWYSTNHILPDARMIAVGEKRQHNYEFYPKIIRDSSSGSRLSALLVLFHVLGIFSEQFGEFNSQGYQLSLLCNINSYAKKRQIEAQKHFDKANVAYDQCPFIN